MLYQHMSREAIWANRRFCARGKDRCIAWRFCARGKTIFELIGGFTPPVDPRSIPGSIGGFASMERPEVLRPGGKPFIDWRFCARGEKHRRLLTVASDSTLLPPCFQLASTLLALCFHLASTLLLPFFHLASILLPPCFHLASTLFPLASTFLARCLHLVYDLAWLSQSPKIRVGYRLQFKCQTIESGP